MFELTDAAAVSAPRSLTEPVTVLCVVDEDGTRERVADALGREDELAVLTAADADDALDRLEDADCVVVADGQSDRAGAALLSAVRDRDPTLPFVLFGASLGDAAETVLDAEWTDVVRTDGLDDPFRLLSHRVRRLVGHRRSAAMVSRTLAAVDTAADGIAIVAPDGTVEFVNRPYASRFGYETGEVIDAPWREFYTAEAIDRLESNALPTVSEGWRWSGECTARHADGSTFETRTTLVGLDDGSLVISHPDTAAAQG